MNRRATFQETGLEAMGDLGPEDVGDLRVAGQSQSHLASMLPFSMCVAGRALNADASEAQTPSLRTPKPTPTPRNSEQEVAVSEDEDAADADREAEHQAKMRSRAGLPVLPEDSLPSAGAQKIMKLDFHSGWLLV